MTGTDRYYVVKKYLTELKNGTEMNPTSGEETLVYLIPDQMNVFAKFVSSCKLEFEFRFVNTYCFHSNNSACHFQAVRLTYALDDYVCSQSIDLV